MDTSTQKGSGSATAPSAAAGMTEATDVEMRDETSPISDEKSSGNTVDEARATETKSEPYAAGEVKKEAADTSNGRLPSPAQPAPASSTTPSAPTAAPLSTATGAPLAGGVGEWYSWRMQTRLHNFYQRSKGFDASISIIMHHQCCHTGESPFPERCQGTWPRLFMRFMKQMKCQNSWKTCD